jgi:hypothetical protein
LLMPQKWIPRNRFLAAIGFLLCLPLRDSLGQTPVAGPSALASPRSTLATQAEMSSSRPFTAEEKGHVIGKLLAVSPAARHKTPHRRKVLSVTLPTENESAPRREGRRLARALVFDYGNGTASRLLVDAGTGATMNSERVRGRPQASEEEKQDALRIIRRDPDLERLLQAKAIPEGGFVVDGPRTTPAWHRFLQVQLLSPDRLHLQRTVIVDLTSETVAASQAGD